MSGNGSLHSLQLQDVAGKGEAPQSREIPMILGSKGRIQHLGEGVLGYVPGEKLRNMGTTKGHLEAPRRGSLRRAGNTSYLLSPRSRVLSFMRAVRAYPLVAGRDMWD